MKAKVEWHKIVEQKLNLQKKDDWYKVKQSDLRQIGALTYLKHHHSGSLVKYGIH